MNSKQESIELAISVANYLWPEFVVVNDLVFFSWSAPKDISIDQRQDKTEIEQFLNHTHVLDIFSHSAIIHGEWNQNHQDFIAACKFGRMWAEAVASKLSREFPDRSFFVYYTEQDNPIVRFHQNHPGEAPLIRANDFQKEIASGSIVIHCVGDHSKR